MAWIKFVLDLKFSNILHVELGMLKWRNPWDKAEFFQSIWSWFSDAFWLSAAPSIFLDTGYYYVKTIIFTAKPQGDKNERRKVTDNIFYDSLGSFKVLYFRQTSANLLSYANVIIVIPSCTNILFLRPITESKRGKSNHPCWDRRKIEEIS